MSEKTIKISKVSIKDVFNVFGAFPSRGKVSISKLYDETEWNLVDLPKKQKEKLPMSFFRGKTIVPVYEQMIGVYPPLAMSNFIDTIQNVNYKVTFSSYENFFLYPPHLLFDFDTSTFSRTARDMYDLIGRYKGGGRSSFTKQDGTSRIIEGEWIQLDMSVYITALKITLLPHQDRLAEAPETLSVIGLQSNGLWNLIGKMSYTLSYEKGSKVDCHLNNDIKPCCSYRLICEKTSRMSGPNCTSFSLSDVRILGVTEKESIPSVEIVWHNGKRHKIAINNTVRDFDSLTSGLCNEPIKEILLGNDNTVCNLYKGIAFTGTPVVFDKSIQSMINSTSNVYSSVKVFSKTLATNSLPFGFEGLKAVFMFGNEKIKQHDDSLQMVPIGGNLSPFLDPVRGYCLKLTFGSVNLQIMEDAITPPFSWGNFTVMFWLKRDVPFAEKRSLLEDAKRSFVMSVVNNQLEFEHIQSGIKVVDTKACTSSEWIHYAVSSDGSTLKLYRNGVLHRFVDVSSTSKMEWNGLEIGRNWSSPLSVLIDNVRVYDRVISPGPLKHLFDFEYFNPLY
jgi:hypothetical protein